jgi:integrase
MLLPNYIAFCEELRVEPYTPSSVRFYITRRLELNDPKSTLRNRLLAIKHAAVESGHPDPTDNTSVRRIRSNAIRALPAREPRRATPATYEALHELVEAIATTARANRRDRAAVAMALRDRAMVLLGFALGRRGSELARVMLEDITRRPGGLLIRIPYSKTNKSGEPEFIGVPRFRGDPLCPVSALDRWLKFAAITSGPIFTTLSPVPGKNGKSVSALDITRRLKSIAARAGLEGFWSSHSLRRGVVTSAEAAGVARSRTNTLTGWKSDAMYAIYADHRNKIAASPLHEIFGQRPRKG